MKNVKAITYEYFPNTWQEGVQGLLMCEGKYVELDEMIRRAKVALIISIRCRI